MREGLAGRAWQEVAALALRTELETVKIYCKLQMQRQTHVRRGTQSQKAYEWYLQINGQINKQVHKTFQDRRVRTGNKATNTRFTDRSINYSIKCTLHWLCGVFLSICYLAIYMTSDIFLSLLHGGASTRSPSTIVILTYSLSPLGITYGRREMKAVRPRLMRIL